MRFSDTHIIVAPNGVTPWLHLRDALLTIIAWAVYIYWMQDFFYFLGDVIDWTFHDFTNAGSYPSFKIMSIMLSYALVVIILSVIFVIWALYNQIRFRGKNRRKSSPPVQQSDLAEMYQIPVDYVNQLQQAKSVVMHHDDNGSLTELNIL